MKLTLIALSFMLLTASLYAQSAPTEEITTSSEWDGKIKKETTTRFNGDKVKTEQITVETVYIDQKISNQKTTTSLFDSAGVVVNEAFEEDRYDYATGKTKVVNKKESNLVFGSMVLTCEELEDFDKSTKITKSNEYSEANGNLTVSILCEFDEVNLYKCNIKEYFEKSGPLKLKSETTYEYAFYENSISSIRVTAGKREGESTDDLRTYDFFNNEFDKYTFKKGTKLKGKEQEKEMEFAINLAKANQK